MTIPAEGATFVVSADAGEVSGAVSATNETRIVLEWQPDGWSSEAFTISHRDAAGRRWALDVMAARWQ